LRTVWAWGNCAASWKICLFKLYPQEYKKISLEIESRRPELEANLEKITVSIRDKLTENGVAYIEIQGRVKRLFSLWKKLKKQKISIEQVYDLIAARIITPNDKKYCYLTLSVIHDVWTPVPERFKDWIAIPRDNLYQSLHTSVIGDKAGSPLKFKSEPKKCTISPKKAWRRTGNTRKANLASVKKTQVSMNFGRRSKNFCCRWSNRPMKIRFGRLYRVFETRFIPERRLCVYADGQSHSTAARRTPIDFAFAIHSQVGDTCTGAKINGRIVPLRDRTAKRRRSRNSNDAELETVTRLA
jgi:GTP pyrophosphokinase